MAELRRTRGSASLTRTHIADDDGGTEILQTVRSDLSITHGADQLRTLKFTPTVSRTYAACCHTPLYNIKEGIPLMGVIAGAVRADLNDLYGPIEFRVMAKRAKGPLPSTLRPRPHNGFPVTVFPRMVFRVWKHYPERHYHPAVVTEPPSIFY